MDAQQMPTQQMQLQSQERQDTGGQNLAPVQIENAPTYVDTPQGKASRVTVVPAYDSYLPSPSELWSGVQAGSYAIILLATLLWVVYSKKIGEMIDRQGSLAEKVENGDQRLQESTQQILKQLQDNANKMDRLLELMYARNKS